MFDALIAYGAVWLIVSFVLVAVPFCAACSILLNLRDIRWTVHGIRNDLRKEREAEKESGDQRAAASRAR